MILIFIGSWIIGMPDSELGSGGAFNQDERSHILAIYKALTDQQRQIKIDDSRARCKIDMFTANLSGTIPDDKEYIKKQLQLLASHRELLPVIMEPDRTAKAKDLSDLEANLQLKLSRLNTLSSCISAIGHALKTVTCQSR